MRTEEGGEGNEMTARDHGQSVLAVLSFADAGSVDFDALGSSYLIGREIVIKVGMMLEMNYT